MYESSVLVIMIFFLMFHLALLGKLYSKETSAAAVAADLQLHQVCAPSMVSPLPADADGSSSSKEERGRC